MSMFQATGADVAVLQVHYDEETASDRTQIVLHPDGSTFYVPPEWIADQVEAGVFLLISRISSDEIRQRLG
jgi:hypothetical protein